MALIDRGNFLDYVKQASAESGAPVADSLGKLAEGILTGHGQQVRTAAWAIIRAQADTSIPDELKKQQATSLAAADLATLMEPATDGIQEKAQALVTLVTDLFQSLPAPDVGGVVRTPQQSKKRSTPKKGKV